MPAFLKAGRCAATGGIASALEVCALSPAPGHAATAESISVNLASTVGTPTSVGEGFLYGLYNGTAHWSTTTGSTATYTFSGTQVAIHSVKDVDQGIAGYSFDGGPVTYVDDYSPSRLPQATLFSSYGLTPGTHTGTGTTIYGVKDVDQGVATYSADGGPARSVDDSSPTRLAGAPLYTVSGLTNGTHTVTINITGIKNSASKNDTIALDYATVS